MKINNSNCMHIFIFIALLCFMPTSLFALLDAKIVNKQKINELSKTEIAEIINEKKVYYDFGLWLDYRYTKYSEDDNDISIVDSLDDSFDLDSRLWFKVIRKSLIDQLDKTSQMIYVRVKDLISNSTPGLLIDSYDHQGPSLDYAYGVFKQRNNKFEIGRKYFSIGKGIAYSDVGDGIQFNYGKPKWNIGTFVSQNVPSSDNLDYSVPGYDKKQKRQFYCLGIGYGGIINHSLYGYYLKQNDNSKEDPIYDVQEYRYDSNYFGVGSIGRLSQNFEYWIELIYENGRSFVYDINLKSRISAWASTAGVSYTFNNVDGNPQINYEYGFGSGDKDRINVTNTQDGNIEGHDNNFLYFGYYPSGYALSPRLSNIYINKLGFNWNPYSNSKNFKNLNIAVDLFLYLKDRPAGGISDVDASNNSRNIGQEVDFTMSWQILSDVKLSVYYGYFIPKSAYLDTANDPSQYFSSSLSFEF